MVIWLSKTNTGGESYVAAQRYDADGNALGTEVALTAYSQRASTPEATLLEDGSVAVSWRLWDEDSSSYQLFVTVYDVVPATLDTIDPVLTGTNGEDVITAHDTIATSLFGHEGNDIMTGGSLDDILDGGEGHDRLNGGGGSNILTGGAGADTFVFNSSTGSDHITDFETGVDRIDLTGFTDNAEMLHFELGDLSGIKINCFSDKSINALWMKFVQNGADVDIYVITNGADANVDAIGTLADISISDLSINDFIF